MHPWRSLSRSVLVFTNVLFLLLGAVLLTLGGYMVSLPELNEFSEDGVASSLITCGSLIVLIALLGGCGAQWESKVFLFPYAILVLVSIIAEFTLAGFMFHVHDSLVNASAHSFDLSQLAKDDQSILKWINRRFKDAYRRCGLTVDVDLTSDDHELMASCSNPEFKWFAPFVINNCKLKNEDLLPGSDFLSCAGHQFTLGQDSFTEHTMLCACESRLITWVNDQSLLIGVFVLAVALFEIALVALSCYIMCSRRGKRHGYQEIRMPLSKQPFNPHPRNYQTASANVGRADHQSIRMSADQQPNYASWAGNQGPYIGPDQHTGRSGS